MPNILFVLYARKSPRHNWYLYFTGTESDIKENLLPTMKQQTAIFGGWAQPEYELFSYDAALPEWELPSNIRNTDLVNNPNIQWYEHV